MTPKQSDILYRLFVTNLIVWGGLGFLLYGMPFIEEQNNTRATAIALQQTRFAPTPSPTSAISPSTPTPQRSTRSTVSTTNPKNSGPIIVATAAPIPAQAVAAPVPSGN